MSIIDNIRPVLVDGQVLVYNPKTFALNLYHPYTGKLAENLYTYLEKQPELSKGIGKIEPAGFGGYSFFKITTKDNQNYWFSPYDKSLSSENNNLQEEKNQSVFCLGDRERF